MSIFFPSFAVWPWSRERRSMSRGPRRSEASGRRGDRRRSTATLGSESLEPRALMAVTATLSGTTLQISLSEAGDAASLSSDSTTYSVTGSGVGDPLTFAVSGVSAITVAGTAAADGQSFTLAKGASIASPLNVAATVESTTITSAISASNLTGDDVSIGSGAITLANDVTNFGGGVLFSGAVTLAADVTVSSLFTTFFNKELRFAGTVDGPYKLTTVNGQLDAFFDSVVGGKAPLASLTTSNQSPVGRISLKSVRTTGAQQYNEISTLQGVYTTSGGAFGTGRNTTLAGDTKLATAGGGITLSGTVNGAKNLEIAAGAGAVTFSKSVGGSSPLASLWVYSAGSVTANSTVKLDGSASGAKPHGLAIAAGVNNVVMKANGSVIKNFSAAGIILGGTTGSKLIGFSSSNNGYAGLMAMGTCTNTVISGASIYGNPMGVVLDGAQGLTINGNTYIGQNTQVGVMASGDSVGSVIAGNVIVANKTGIMLSGARNLEISSKGGTANTISSNTEFGVVAVGNLSGSSISGATIYANPTGILLNGAQNLSINGGNTIANGTLSGVNAQGDLSGTVIAGNVVFNNRTGVLLAGAQNLEISSKGGTANTISSNTEFGVVAVGNLSGTSISGATVYANPTGILLNGAQNLSINGGNTIANSTLSGVNAQGDLSGTVFAGNVVFNNGTGMLLAGVQNLEISSKGGTVNTISSNTEFGVVGTGNLSGTSISGATVYANPTGILLNGAQNLSINGGNTIANNTLSGVNAQGDLTGSVIAGNVIYNNATGLLLAGAQNLEVSSKGGVVNTISFNPNYGMVATGDCKNTVVAGNVIYGNATGIVLSSVQGLAVNGTNNVNNNTSVGMVASGDCAGTRVTGNLFGSNPTGIILNGARNLTLDGLNYAGNYGGLAALDAVAVGLLATGVCTGTTVTRNVFNINATGVLLNSAQGLTINGLNAIQTNSNAGLVANGDCAGTTIVNNVFTANPYGVALSAAQNLTINGDNQIVANTAFGLYASGNSVGTNVTGNTISGNGVNIDTSTAVGGTFQTS